MSVVVKTKMFKISIEIAFAILKEDKILDAKTFADRLKCSLGTANKWLMRMTEEKILIRSPVVISSGGIGARKYVYIRNNSVRIHYDYALRERLFQEKFRGARVQ